MVELVMVRHGQSTWNLDNRFTGWTDVDLTERGIEEGHEMIVPILRQGQKVLICAHGNSIRALVKYLDDVSDEQIVKLNIPTGIPLVYELDEDLKARSHYYLADEEKVRAATATVASQLTAGRGAT